MVQGGGEGSSELGDDSEDPETWKDLQSLGDKDLVMD